MPINTIIDGIQLQTYLDNYKVLTNLQVINFQFNYSMEKYVKQIETNLFYSDNSIEVNDLEWQENISNKEIELVLNALNGLRLKLI